MTGQGSSQTDLGGFLIANLAHHDDVGILPQKGPHGRREREPDLGLDLHLIHSPELVLDGVLDGTDDSDYQEKDSRPLSVLRSSGGLARVRGGSSARSRW